MAKIARKMSVDNKQLVGFLGNITAGSGMLDTVKIRYRPYVSPFSDLLSMIRTNDRIADIGCGSGQFLLLCSEFSKPASVYGIEISEALVKNAVDAFEQHGKVPFEFDTYDGIHFPEKISGADLVFLIDVLHHVPVRMQKQFLDALWTRLRAGASLVIKDIDAASPLVYMNKLHDTFLGGGAGHEWKAADMHRYFAEKGGVIEVFEKKRMLVYPHFTLKISKR